MIQSGVFTLVARTRIRTSSSPTGGRSTSSSLSTRCGAPYLCWTMAFIVPPVGVAFMSLMACTLAMSSTSSGCPVSMHEGYDRSSSAGIGLLVEQPGT